jgi:ABC-2 type transport system permease protein
VAGLSQVWILIADQLRRRIRSIGIWGAALGGLGALYVALYPSMSRLLEQYVEEAPEQMQQYMGGLQGPISIEQWLGMELVNVLIPVALPFMVMVMGARAIAGSEERKTLDLLLSNPLPRQRVIAGTVGTMGLSLAGVLAITWVLTYIAVPVAGVDLSPDRLAAALAALWPLCLFFGTLALLISALVRRGFLAIAIAGVILVAMYVLDSLAQVSKSMEPLRVLSLFYHLGRPLEGDFPWTAVLLMLAGVCIFVGGAMAAFARRDIYT